MKLTPQQIAWIRSAEIAIGGAVGSAVLQAFTAGGFPHTKAGWGQFFSIVLASAYGAFRLYLMQSPIQNVVSSTAEKQVVDMATGLAEKITETTTTEVSPAAPVADAPALLDKQPADHGQDS